MFDELHDPMSAALADDRNEGNLPPSDAILLAALTVSETVKEHGADVELHPNVVAFEKRRRVIEKVGAFALNRRPSPPDNADPQHSRSAQENR